MAGHGDECCRSHGDEGSVKMEKVRMVSDGVMASVLVFKRMFAA